MRTGIIYMAISPSGKIYIGKTVQRLHRRKTGHYCDSKNENLVVYTSKLSKAIRKYGIDNFKWEILYKDVPENQLDLAEICAIYIHDSYYSGYNSTIGGDGGKTWNVVWTEEGKKKVSNTLKGHKVSQETRDRISNSLKENYYSKNRKVVSEETRKRQSESMKILWNKKKKKYIELGE